ncbi:putative RNA-directed DNA polymerase from transposon X-element [Trichonephila clavipes]|nr:putative RNA-directed DNA polymerase from transposon X-element [Trichonephila clavipes]
MIEKDNVMCGTMVIVKEDFTPVCNWLLGRVVEVNHGSDGKGPLPQQCANCSGEHAANWSRCPKHPNNAKKKNSNQNNKNKNGPKPKNNPNNKKTVPQVPRPDISKARKVSPDLDYSKVVQNLIPREHVSSPSTSTALPTPAPSKDASVNAGLLKYLLVIIEDIPCIDKQVFCRAFKNSLSALRLASADVDKTYVIFEAYSISELNQNFSEAFVEASKPKFKNVTKILSLEIKSKIHQRNRLRKFWQRTRCPSIYSEFRTLSREIAKDIKSYSHTQWEKHIEALSPEDNTLSRKSSILRKPFRSIPPLKGALGSTAITPIEKAEVTADSLQEQFEPNHVADREDFDQRIHEEVENFLFTSHG